MPETIGHEYLIGWLLEIGIAMYSGMGVAPITYSEIYAWADGIELTPWEAKTIREMSVEYVSYSQKASESNCPPPFAPPKTIDQQKDLSKRLSSTLDRLSKPKQKPVPIQNKRIKPACQI